ncbi:hypothetical protein B0H14DRAFT_2629746 [Mycena olivaceomarginata]|nr:hypothetical protein B0H14DRAFT_2629746 [Mycena olivaceomarginata]
MPLRLLVHSSTSSWACSPRISLEVLRVHIRAFERCIDIYQLHPDGDFSHNSTLRSIFEDGTAPNSHYHVQVLHRVPRCTISLVCFPGVLNRAQIKRDYALRRKLIK